MKLEDKVSILEAAAREWGYVLEDLQSANNVNLSFIRLGFDNTRRRIKSIETHILDLQEGQGDIKLEVKRLDNRVEQGFTFTSKQLDGLRSGQDGLRAEVSGLRSGQDGLRAEVSGLRSGQEALSSRQDQFAERQVELRVELDTRLNNIEKLLSQLLKNE